MIIFYFFWTKFYSTASEILMAEKLVLLVVGFYKVQRWYNH
jgi:hypothetical protein